MQSALVRYLLLVVWVCTILEENHAFNCRALIPGRKTVKIMDTLVQPIMSNWLTTEPMSTLENNDATISLEDLSFDDETWQAYESAVLDFMESPRVLKKDKPEDLQEAKEILLSKCGLPLVPSPLTDGEEFGNRMKQQMDIFKGHYNLTKGQFGFLHRCLVYMGDHCAKNRNARPILVAWHKLKECGIIPRENCISTYMYILSTDKSCGEILGEVAAFHDVFFSPNEKTVTLRIKTLIGKNDVEKAEKVLASLSDKQGCGEWTKLRTCLPLMEYYCNKGDGPAILRLFRNMRQSTGVFFDSDVYALIIGSLARFRFFCVDGVPIEGARDVGFSSTHGPELFDEIALEMADDLLELSEVAATNIMNGFLEGFAESNDSVDFDGIPTISDAPTSAAIITGRVDIDDKTAKCPVSEAKLRLFALDDTQRQHVHDTLLEMAQLKYMEFTKKKPNSTEDKNYGFEELFHFSEWLNTREGDPFTVVVDGPNIAYYGKPEPHHSQLKMIVEQLKKMGENPLVTMPKKYTARKIWLTPGKISTLSDKDLDFLESLRQEERMYTVPPRCLDDYYWMLASVSNQTNARQLSDLRVSTNDEGGRFPGIRPMLITNDQMRDHKLDLLEPREFRRWCSCHIVNYNITQIVEDEWEEREVEFSPADFFSREIQGNSHGIGKGLIWHLPVSEWEEPSRFCVWISR